MSKSYTNKYNELVTSKPTTYVLIKKAKKERNNKQCEQNTETTMK